MRTAWTRPGRIVSDVSAISPPPSRRPSWSSVTVSRYSWLNRRQVTATTPISHTSPPPLIDGSRDLGASTAVTTSAASTASA